MDKVEKTNEEWKKVLDEETYNVTRQGGTETPFTGKYNATKDKGMYKCSNCGLELFSSETKFDSGTGWPSFTDPANKENVELVTEFLGRLKHGQETTPSPDDRAGMRRTEVRCKRCGAHLGHVFDDGPTDKGGKRFCINSCALDLEKK